MKKLTLTFGLMLFVLFGVASVGSVSAASLQFDPTTKSVTKGETFTIKLDIDAGTNEILATDIKGSYDKTLLDLVSIVNGTYFSTAGKIETETDGAFYYAGIVDDPGDFKTGTGTVAIATFKALSDGTATISYICTPGETGEDSNIANNDFDATDVINCAENGTSRITIGTGGGGGGGATSTPAPTNSAGSATNTPAPTITSLPETGFFDDATNKFGMAIPISMTMVMLGVVVKLLFL